MEGRLCTQATQLKVFIIFRNILLKCISRVNSSLMVISKKDSPRRRGCAGGEGAWVGRVRGWRGCVGGEGA